MRTAAVIPAAQLAHASKASDQTMTLFAVFGASPSSGGSSSNSSNSQVSLGLALYQTPVCPARKNSTSGHQVESSTDLTSYLTLSTLAHYRADSCWKHCTALAKPVSLPPELVTVHNDARLPGCKQGTHDCYAGLYYTNNR